MVEGTKPTARDQEDICKHTFDTEHCKHSIVKRITSFKSKIWAPITQGNRHPYKNVKYNTPILKRGLKDHATDNNSDFPSS